MVGLSIRPYRRPDEEAVIDLWNACGLVVPHNDPHQDILRKLKVSPEWFLIGERDRRVISTCMVGYEGHRGWINYLAVEPKQRRSGVATAMMAEAERLLKGAGCPKINLQIRSSNADVIAFYEALGFKPDSVMSLGKRLEVSDGPQVQI